MPDMVRETARHVGDVPDHRSSQVSVPAPDQVQGQTSPDGLWRWDGSEWQPTVAPSTAARPESSPRSWLAILGGVFGLVALPVVLAGCFLPFINWTDTSNGTSASIFNPGSAGAYWYAVEPVEVVVLAIPAAILLMVLKGRTARALVSGVLIAFGLQTIGMFAGYALGDLGFGRIGPGGPVGMIGGAILFTGGAFGLGSLLTRA